jgi:ubiquinone/menaquinone biosynthesis C-methylase UbiE
MPPARPSTFERRSKAWFPTHIGIDERYVRAIRERKKPGERVLHLGAGRDSLDLARRIDAVGDIVSVDVDEQGLRNNASSARVLADGGVLPFRDGSFDIVLCENVLEHLEFPERVLAEAQRVLRGSGRFHFMCPNAWSYIAIAARFTPLRFHVWYRGLTQDTAEEDTFGKFYRANTRGQIERLATQTGFDVELLESHVGSPSYWEVNDLAHRVGVALHWLLERGPKLTHITLTGVLRKRG